MPVPTHEASLNLTHTIYQDLASWARSEPTLLTNLYKSPHATQAVLRSLPPIARLYVARLLFVPPEDSHPTLDSFRAALRRRQRARDRHDAAVNALRALHVFVDAPLQPNGTSDAASVALNPCFAAGLRKAVSGQLAPVFGGPVDSSALHVDVANFASAKLERILNYLVESSGVDTPSQHLVHALVHAHVLEAGREGLCITSAGFQFLLQDTFAQLWVLLRAILFAHFMHARLASLDLLFRLSFTSPGRRYAMDEVDEVQRELLNDLHELGIVMCDGDSFRPTDVGVRLLGSAGRVTSGTNAHLVSKSAGEIEIFVETNFRLYAYTTSAFQTNLLGLFTHLRYRLPGMIVGHLTRDAVRKALQNGITGDQIIGYLNAHAHPRMKKGVVPSNVSDEIRLWEAEQERVTTEPSVLLSEFRTYEAFERVVGYASSISGMLWHDSHRQQLVVAKRVYDMVKNFIKSNGIQ